MNSSPFSSATTQAELITLVKSGKIPPLPSQYSSALGRVIRAMLNLNVSCMTCWSAIANPTANQATLHQRSDRDGGDEATQKIIDRPKPVRHQVSNVCCKLTSRMEILQSRKKELEDYEVRLRARANAFIERDKQLAAREAAVGEREAGIVTREAALAATHDRYQQAAEALQGSWDRFKEEQDQFRERQHQVLQAPEAAGGYGAYSLKSRGLP